MDDVRVRHARRGLALTHECEAAAEVVQLAQHVQPRRAEHLHTRCTCTCGAHAHALYTRCPCGAHAVFMRCTCSTGAKIELPRKMPEHLYGLPLLPGPPAADREAFHNGLRSQRTLPAVRRPPPPSRERFREPKARSTAGQCGNASMVRTSQPSSSMAERSSAATEATSRGSRPARLQLAAVLQLSPLWYVSASSSSARSGSSRCRRLGVEGRRINRRLGPGPTASPQPAVGPERLSRSSRVRSAARSIESRAQEVRGVSCGTTELFHKLHCRLSPPSCTATPSHPERHTPTFGGAAPTASSRRAPCRGSL